LPKKFLKRDNSLINTNLASFEKIENKAKYVINTKKNINDKL